MYTHLYKNIYPVSICPQANSYLLSYINPVLICTQANSCPLSYIYPVLICCRERLGKGAGRPCDNN